MKAIFLSLVLVTFAVQAWALDENLADATVKAMKWPGYEGAKTPTIDILKNTSQVLRFDRSIMRVAISNVAICDVTMVGEKDVLVYAKTAGNANLLVWDTSDAISM